ncbi:MAG: TonB-dependent receptor [Bacteroidales bacterium]|nr:TonB-dependent receptor [Bacteroidales bacterium]
MRKILFAACVYAINTLSLSAQGSITVTGRVSDESGVPLPGATVVLKGTNTGVVGDAEGRYSISAPDEEAVLVFSFVGFSTREIIVGNQHIIDVQLREEQLALEEVVVIGYGSVKKKDLTGAVAQVKTEQFNTQQSVTALDYLNGTVAGFNSNIGTSASGTSSMEIRGPASLAASNTPLLVLDGVIFNGSINEINPLDIETIDVLKDASSAAVYGSRSAAGVVIITTKKGRGEKMSVNFSAQLGISDFTKEIKPFDVEGYLKYHEDFLVRINPGQQEAYFSHPDRLPAGIDLDTWQNYDPSHSENPVETWMNRLKLQAIEQENYTNGKSFDWYKAATQTGLRKNYDVSLSGGTGKMSYYWSLGYTDNSGKMKGDAFSTVRSRINADAKVTDFLNIGVNAQFSHKDMSAVSIDLLNTVQQSPLGAPYDENGKIRWYPHDDAGVVNPFMAHDYRDKYNIAQNLFATIYADLKLPFGFGYRVSVVNRFDWGKNYYFDPPLIRSGSLTNGVGERINTSLYEWQVDNVLSWRKTFGAHDFYATALYNAEKRQTWQDTGHSEDFQPNDLLSYHQLKSGIAQNLSSDDTYATGTALMGRINYTLLDRYLLTLSVRRDGYSAFGVSNPYAVFPSAALAWNISEEPFFRVQWIDNLKIRASYGVNGNRDIGVYEALAQLGTTKYLTGATPISGIYSNSMANSKLKWEKTTAANLGTDFSVMGGRLSGTVDYYLMTTRDLLLQRSLPAIIGYASVMSNMGELQNRGFELTLNSRNFDGERFRWNSSLAFSLNRNKIVHLYGDMADVLDENGNVVGQKEADDIVNKWFIGEAIDRIWDYEFLGIYRAEEEEEAKSFGKAPGDVKLYDKDENGVSTQEDKTFQGYSRPRYRIGLRNDFTLFKHFRVSCFFRAQLGYYRQNDLRRHTDQTADRRNHYNLPYWTPENPIDDYTRLQTVNNPAYSLWESTGFLRLQDLSVSYDLPQTLCGKIGMQQCRVYVSSRNLLTFTQWTGWDPESGNTPMPKIFTLGINVSL